MKAHHENIPALRFKEFKEAWSDKSLGDIAKFSKGKGLSKSDIVDNGKTECIRYGELYTHYGETIDAVKSRTNVPAESLILSEANDVIIPASGETQVDIATASCVLRPGIALGGDLNIIKTENNGVFLSYYLNSKRKMDIASLAQGISVVHLYSGQLALLNLSIPSLPEQQKIASFLSTIDEKIQQLTRKKELLEQYKKGVMQQLFSGKLRFKDENGKAYPKWEKKKLGQLTTKIGDGIHSTPQYDETGDYYFVNGNNLSNGKIFFSETTKKVREAEYLKHRRELNQNTILLSINGTIGNLAFYNNENIVLGKSACYLNVHDSVNLLFIYLLLQTSQVQNHFNDELTGSTIKNLSLKTVRETPISLPVIEEQQKIASYLFGIDTKIEIVTTQITQTQTFKKGLLQQMFV